MQLTQYTDYSLRVLIYLSQKPVQELATITEISEFYGISRNHLVKVVHSLSLNGFVETLRGKNGGIRLARPADKIGIGDVVRSTEPNFDLAECFNQESNNCIITPACSLKGILNDARRNFIATLDQYTLADTIQKPGNLFRKYMQTISG